MTFGSVCSGIEAASVAWRPLGWTAKFFAETNPFCCALLKHRYPSVPNYGDFTKLDTSAGPIDVLVGGTPCQSFSVAGRRAGLDDPRGNLTLEFLRLAGRLKPRWILWENVPGILSDDSGRTFGTVLGILGQLGYGFAYRILDAQYFGVPQRRRRVFVVGCFGDWRSAAAVLFESQSLQGYIAPRREKREDVAGTLGGSTEIKRGWANDLDSSGAFIPFNNTGQGWWNEADSAQSIRSGDGKGGGDARNSSLVAHALNAKGGSGRIDFESETFVAETVGALTSCSGTSRKHGYGAGQQEIEAGHVVTHTLRSEGFDASEDGTGRGIPLVAGTLKANNGGGGFGSDPSETFIPDVAPCLTQNYGKQPDNSDTNAGPMLIPILEVHGGSSSCGEGPNGIGIGEPGDPMFTLQRGKQHAVAFANTAGATALSVSEETFPPITTRHGDPGMIAFSCKDSGADSGETSPTLRAMNFDKSHANAGGQVAVAFQSSQSGMRVGEQHPTLDSHNGSRRHHGALVNSAVRRLTPEECESLQGFSRGYTKVPYRGKPAADGPRYAAIGNSFAVPVVRWIGERISVVDGWWALLGSNQRPRPCEDRALTG